MPHPDQVSNDTLTSVARQLGGWLDQSAAAKFRAAGQGPAPTPPATPSPGGPLPAGPSLSAPSSGSESSAPSSGPESSGPLSASESSAPGGAGAGALFEPTPAFELQAFELGESFALYSLGPDDIERGLAGGGDLTQLARATGRWHHQIKVDKKAVGFARSACEGEADFEVRQIYLSELAKYVDEAITWIDDYEAKNPYDAEADPVVRLLTVPAYQVHAFWLCRPGAEENTWAATSEAAAQVAQAAPRAEQAAPRSESGAWADGGQSKVLVIDAPPHLEGLRPNTLLSSKEFLEAFPGREQFGGLVFDPDADYKGQA